MIVYHRTDAAKEILANGFRDAEASYGMGRMFRGVSFSADKPLDADEGARGSAVLFIEIPEEIFAGCECVEDGKPYREVLIPAELANRYPVQVCKECEVCTSEYGGSECWYCREELGNEGGVS